MARDGLEHVRERPARARADLGVQSSAGDEQTPTPRSRPRTAMARHVIWLLLVVGLGASLAASRRFEVPTLVEQSLAAGLGVVLTVGLAVRGGRDARLYCAAGTVLGVAAVALQWDPLLGGAAIGTGVVTACLAVLGTRPAATFARVVLEVVLALALATVGGLAVAGFGVELDPERITYTVLVIAVAVTFGLVYRLGGGLHGLGARGLVLSIGALALLVIVVVYTAALTRYGSPELVADVQSARQRIRDTLGGIPSPVEVLIGIPALAWGVSMRSRRRQGWWVCAFGVAATATAATRLVGDGTTPLSTVLGTVLGAGYSIVLGLLIGLVLTLLEQLITFSRDRRTPRSEHLANLREEAPRMQALH